MLFIYLTAFTLSYMANLASATGCCCGIACIQCSAPACPPPPVCPPPKPPVTILCEVKKCEPSGPPACPPPPPCPPPEVCDPCPECPEPPPPPPCPECPSPPPPPPPPPCPPTSCPPPPPPPQSCVPQPSTQTDCCQGCVFKIECSAKQRRRFRSRSRSRMRKSARVSKRVKRGIALEEHEVFESINPVCNNGALKKLMLKSISKDLEATKRTIQKNAEAKFKQNFNVICSEAAFTYVAHTTTFCQASIDGVNCYAFSF